MKAIHRIFLLLLSCLSIGSRAQTPAWQWATGPTGQSVVSAICTGGNHEFVAGHFLGALAFGADSLNDNQGPYQDIFIAKYDALGHPAWTKNAIGYADANGISTDASGNVYVVGTFFNDSIIFGSHVLVNPNLTPQSSNIFFVKYDSSGNVIWAKNLGGINNDLASAITIHANDNLYVVGTFMGDSLKLDNVTIQHLGNNDGFIAKFDTAGKAIWIKSVGSPYIDGATSVCTDGLGNVFMAGYFQGSHLFLGSTGNYLTSPYAYNVFITKYDSLGNLRWAKYAGSNNGNGPGGIAADATGNVYVTGYFSDTVTVSNETITSDGLQNIFTAKYDSSGSLLWAKGTGGDYIDQSTGITLDENSNAYITGYFQSDTIRFDNLELINPVGNQVAFVAEYNAAGQAITAVAPQGTSNSAAAGIAYGEGSIYVTGAFQSGAIIFGNDTLTNSINFFLARLDTSISTSIAPVNMTANKILVYPNPSTSRFNFTGVPSGSNIEVFNLLGQIVYSEITDGDNYSINLTGRANGVYLYRVSIKGSSIQQGKIVVE